MRAAQITEYGGPEVIKFNADAERPQPGEGQVLVEVYAASINPFDWKVREGYMKDSLPLNFPATLGGDVAGVVAELGDGVAGFTVGDEVFGQANAAGGQGSYAEYTLVKASSLTHKPAALSWEEAAALPLTGVSAVQALVDHMNVQAGQKILIHGGAGGIGSFAIQLAKHLGAYVATTAGADDTDYVKSLGADEVIDFRTQKFEDLLTGYDAVFDTIGKDTFTRSFAVLKPGGIIVSMVEKDGDALAKQHSVAFVSQSTQVNPERLAKLVELVEAGALKISIDKTFPLEQAGAAQAYVQEGKHHGKVVLTVKD